MREAKGLYGSLGFAPTLAYKSLTNLDLCSVARHELGYLGRDHCDLIRGELCVETDCLYDVNYTPDRLLV